MLEIQAVRKSFGLATVLAGVDLRIGAGELFSLLGPSGCGKTTLLRILGGFERPDAGEVRLDGARIDHLPPNKRPCHMVFQRYALFPHLDVRRNVGFALELTRLPRAEIDRRVDEALALVEMQELASRRVPTLSGGQQQRVALARAIASRPRFLLLDEPLSALDLKLRQRMQVELVHLQRRLSITFVFVTHDQEEALTLSDRVAVMRAGRIEQIGAPQEVYRRPSSAFVAGFIGQANELEGRLVGPGAADVDGIGVLPVVASGVGVGQKLRVLVRPEHLRLGARGDRAAIDVLVEDLLFKGPHVEAIVRPRVRPEVALSVHVPGVEAAGLRSGEGASLHWPGEAACAFAAEPPCT
jgi:ABC-type Fe3+/spermidine/putrescine transport system ATPase subunit